MIVVIELRPVQGHSDLLAGAHPIRDPLSKVSPHIDPGVFEQPIYLLNGVLGNQTPGVGQSLSYGIYC
jgi:hypothetical protein